MGRQGAPYHRTRSVAQDIFRWTCVLGIIALVVTLLIGDLLERRHVYRIPLACIAITP